jgi:hypothetical protein
VIARLATLLRRHPGQDDGTCLRMAALARGESEHQLFTAAWESWHGVEPPAGRIDADFDAWLRDEPLPPYVRQFLRDWLARHPALQRRRASDHRATARARLIALAVLVAALLLALELFFPS